MRGLVDCANAASRPTSGRAFSPTPRRRTCALSPRTCLVNNQCNVFAEPILSHVLPSSRQPSKNNAETERALKRLVEKTEKYDVRADLNNTIDDL